MSSELTLFDDFHRDVDSLFRDFGRSFAPMLTSSDIAPLRGTQRLLKLDLIERPKEFLMHLDVPGVPKENINIDVREDILTVTAERKQEKKTEQDNYYRMERSFGKMSRSIRLPENADAQGISAKCDQGELLISIPKRAVPEPKLQRITIE